MGLKIIWSGSALEQYADRLDHLGGFSPEAARRVRASVDDSLNKLRDFPELGRWVPEFGPGFYQEILVKPLRLFYERHDQGLVITHVQRQEEDLRPDTFGQDG